MQNHNKVTFFLSQFKVCNEEYNTYSIIFEILDFIDLEYNNDNIYAFIYFITNNKIKMIDGRKIEYNIGIETVTIAIVTYFDDINKSSSFWKTRYYNYSSKEKILNIAAKIKNQVQQLDTVELVQ